MVAEAERPPARNEQKYWKELEANGLDRIEIVGGAEYQAPETTPRHGP